MKTLVHKLQSSEAAEIAEAALVLPVVFVFLLGIVWFGRAFNIYSTIQQAAQQGAIAAARPTCATCVSTTSTFPSDGTVVNAVTAVMQASSLDPGQIPSNSSSLPKAFCTNPPGACSTGNISICRQVLFNPDPSSPSATQPPANQPPICGTLVSFQYPFQFYLPFTSLNLSSITLTAQAQSRTEN
ncbi:MAG: TadE family protein [Terriglobales bacterium]